MSIRLSRPTFARAAYASGFQIGDDIWVVQRDAPDGRSEGIRDLQEALNEVASRHRAIQIAPHGLLARNGQFDDATRKLVALYLLEFPKVRSGADYPYDLRNIGPDRELLTYIKEEYAPFDPDSEGNKGRIVDRRLLVGSVFDTTPDRIDGLWELYQGVVMVLRDGMRAYAQSYLDCDTFWLHRPVSQATPQYPFGIPHQPYAAAVDEVFACNTSELLRTKPDLNSLPLLQGALPVTILAGQHLLAVPTPPGAEAEWVQIRHPDIGLGWVRATSGRLLKNDAGRYRVPPDGVGVQARNHGNLGQVAPGNSYSEEHTSNGVAYTYGGKQTPAEWRASLVTNPLAAPTRLCTTLSTRRGIDLERRPGSTRATTIQWCPTIPIGKQAATVPDSSTIVLQTRSFREP